jgi:hypothetical protein
MRFPSSGQAGTHVTGTEQEHAPAVTPARGLASWQDAGAARGPLLGRLGRTLALLYPASPVVEGVPGQPRAARHRALRVLAHVAAVGVGAGALLLRQAGTPSWSSLWAEDGTVFLPRALLHPWSSIFREYAGYLQLVPQLIADVVARFPMRDAAAGFAIAGALVASSCAIFVFHASRGHVTGAGFRVLLACSVVLLPTAVIEIANSGVDAPWYLMFALFWALIWRPASRGGMAAAAAVSFLAMASNILNLLYLPLVAARLIALPRVREQAVTSGWLAGIAFQVPGILQSREPHRIGSVPAGFHFYGQHVLVATVAGWPLARGLQDVIGIPACIAAAAVAVSAVVAWAARHGGSRVRVLAAAALSIGLILTIIPAVLRFWVAPAVSTATWVPGSRYTTSAILLIDGIAIVGVDAFVRRRSARGQPAWRRVPVLILVVVLGIGWVSSFRYSNVRSGGVAWSRTYTRYEQALPGSALPGSALPGSALPGSAPPGSEQPELLASGTPGPGDPRGPVEQRRIDRGQERRGTRLAGAAVPRAPAGAGQVQPGPRPRDPDEQQPTLLGEVLGAPGPPGKPEGQQVLLAAGQEHHLELQSLGGVQGQ